MNPKRLFQAAFCMRFCKIIIDSAHKLTYNFTMKTLVCDFTHENLSKARELILMGEVVAFPTETVYGLGADAFDPNAVKKIFEAKGRPADNPLIVHVATKQAAYDVAQEVTADAEKILSTLMPGPITVVLKKQKRVPDEVTAGLDTVAIRMPSSPQARAFLSSAGVPICAPSANTSSRPSPTSWKHVLEDLDGKIPMILKGDDCTVGIESTVLDLTHDEPLILRPGMITKSMIEAVLGKEVKIPDKFNKKMNSPGLRYKHYAPKCDAYLNRDGDLNKIKEFLSDAGAGLIATDKYKGLTDKFFSLGTTESSGAHSIFAKLREAEKVCTKILVVWDFSGEQGYGVLNRVTRSCGGKII